MDSSLLTMPAPFDESPPARLHAHQQRNPAGKITASGRLRRDLELATRVKSRSGNAPIERAILLDVEERSDIHAAAKILHRTNNHSALWADHPHSETFAGGRTSAAVQMAAARAALRPRGRQLNHLASLHCLGFRVSRRKIAEHWYATPLSAVASGCSGALMNYVTAQHCSTFPIRLRLGRAAFAYHPFSSAAKGERTDDFFRGLDEEYPGEGSGADFVTLVQKYNRDGPCPFCNHDDDDSFHLFCECEEPALESERESLRLSLLDMLESARKKIGEMTGLSTPDLEQRNKVFRRLRKLKLAIQLCRANPGGNASDINFVAYRMLTAIPFSAKLPESTVLGKDMPQMPLARALGRVFDATVLQNRFLRPVANIIAKWGTRHIRRFAEVRGWLLKTGP